MKNTWIYIAVAVTLILLGVWFYIGWKKRNGNSEDTETDNDAGANGTPNKLPARGSFACKRNLTTANAQTILQYGDCGKPVKSLQQFLNSMLPITSKITVDGKFGTGTEAALLKVIGSVRIAYPEFNPVTGY